MADVEDVRRAALALPGASERASYGSWPSWRTTARMFALVRTDPDALVVWVSAPEERDALVAADPGRFFTTPHYAGTAVLLVRLDQVDPTEVADLVEESWRQRAPRRLVRELDAP